jgi:hypothetical protein
MAQITVECRGMPRCRLVPFGMAEAKHRRDANPSPLKLRRGKGGWGIPCVYFRLVPITSDYLLFGAGVRRRNRAGAEMGQSPFSDNRTNSGTGGGGTLEPLYPSTRPSPHFAERS